MFCTKCGSQAAAGLQFCPNCGASLATPPLGTTTLPWIPPAGVQAQTGRWISEGWQMVKADIGFYMLTGLIFAVVSGIIPVILQGPMIVGFHIICMKRIMGRPTDFADLFKGFNYFLPALVASLLIGLFTSIGIMLCIIPGLVVAAMYKFTYLFIVDKRMDFWPAMESSHAITKSDYFGFTMFLIVMALVDILGFLCCVVGIFVAIPVTIAAITIAYKEIVGFDQRNLESL
jgi:hypothetical protein